LQERQQSQQSVQAVLRVQWFRKFRTCVREI
jgi:hypothetical protein